MWLKQKKQWIKDKLLGLELKHIQTASLNLPPEDRLEADGRLAPDIFSLDLADPWPLSLGGGVGCLMSGTFAIDGGGANPPWSSAS